MDRPVGSRAREPAERELRLVARQTDQQPRAEALPAPGAVQSVRVLGELPPEVGVVSVA
jgi:hypothetical protein